MCHLKKVVVVVVKASKTHVEEDKSNPEQRVMPHYLNQDWYQGIFYPTQTRFRSIKAAKTSAERMKPPPSIREERAKVSQCAFGTSSNVVKSLI